MIKGSPRYETYSLIEKIKINIFYQLPKTEEIDEIGKWLIICEEIRIKWKEIDMKTIMKFGCLWYMKNLKKNPLNYVKDPKMLILLNEFIGKQKQCRREIESDTINWLQNNYKKDIWKTRKIFDLLKNNDYWIHNFQSERKIIKKELSQWDFYSSKKIKVYKKRIKDWVDGWINNGRNQGSIKRHKLKIININEISHKRKIDQESPYAKCYRCKYKNDKAFIKVYELSQWNWNRNLKWVINEIATLIYLNKSKRNNANIFTDLYGLYIEQIENKYELNAEKNIYLNVVFEWCSGTLKDYIEKFNHDECGISYVIDRIFNGFLLLHNYGIAHNNINPWNIFVKKTEGQLILKINGFTHSSMISSDHAWFSKSVLAEVDETFGFSAPEIWKCIDEGILKAKINRMKADIYSIGLILIYLVSYEFLPVGMLDWENWIEYHMRKLKTPWLKTLLENMVKENRKKEKRLES